MNIHYKFMMDFMVKAKAEGKSYTVGEAMAAWSKARLAGAFHAQ